MSARPTGIYAFLTGINDIQDQYSLQENKRFSSLTENETLLDTSNKEFSRLNDSRIGQSNVSSILSELMFLSGKSAGDSLFENNTPDTPESRTPDCFRPAQPFSERRKEYDEKFQKLETKCIRLGVLNGLLKGLEIKLDDYEEELFEYQNNLMHHEQLVFQKEDLAHEYGQTLVEKVSKLDGMINRVNEISSLLNSKLPCFSENIAPVSGTAIISRNKLLAKAVAVPIKFRTVMNMANPFKWNKFTKRTVSNNSQVHIPTNSDSPCPNPVILPEDIDLIATLLDELGDIRDALSSFTFERSQTY